MTEVNLQSVLVQYGITAASATKISGGLINSTWKVTDGEAAYILQQINTHVFSDPYLIAANTQVLQAHLKAIGSGYPLVAEIPTTSGELIVQDRGSHFRLLPFVRNSNTISVVETPQQAYQAAYQFGLFTKSFEHFDARKLHITIPRFHDLTLRFNQFCEAANDEDKVKSKKCATEIRALKELSGLVDEYEAFGRNRAVKLRVAHHDTKISNVLFDQTGKSICVIDLDTVMPGYFTSDVGDMMRTYVSPAGEEETDFSKIEVRGDFREAIIDGYLATMGDVLSKEERSAFDRSGIWLTYMQALRFLTDYLNGDIYYVTQYPAHNLVRAQNQLTLLQKLISG
jgi:Ser/Thr protein kinase RdoA (MazF antagonist)